MIVPDALESIIRRDRIRNAVSMRIEESLLRPHANNLTLVRLVLASSVIYTHCYWALTGRMGEDDLSAFLGAPISVRSEEHTSELQSLMRISYAVFCLKKKKRK